MPKTEDIQSRQASNYLKNKTRTSKITLVVDKDNKSANGNQDGNSLRNELIFHPAERKLGSKSMKTSLPHHKERRSTYYKYSIK